MLAGQADEVIPKKRKKGKRRRDGKEEAGSMNGGSYENGKRKARWAAQRYQQKALTEAWLSFLALHLPSDLLKQVKRCLSGRLC